jgi:hypothetical protein
MLEQPSYYAIIPANVRYADITPNAKLLYGEITALSNKNGCCSASNEYFSSLYKVSTRTITSWIKELIDNNFVERHIKYKQDSKEVESRTLKLCCQISPGGEKNFLPPIEENFRDNNTSIFNNTSIYKPGEVQGDSFEDWYKEYPRKISKANAKKSYLSALKKVDKDILLSSVKNFSIVVKNNNTEEKFIPHPSTWLNQERWEDYKPKVKASALPMGIRKVDGYWVDLYRNKKLFSVESNPNPDWSKFDVETRSF